MQKTPQVISTDVLDDNPDIVLERAGFGPVFLFDTGEVRWVLCSAVEWNKIANRLEQVSAVEQEMIRLRQQVSELTNKLAARDYWHFLPRNENGDYVFYLADFRTVTVTSAEMENANIHHDLEIGTVDLVTGKQTLHLDVQWFRGLQDRDFRLPR